MIQGPSLKSLFVSVRSDETVIASGTAFTVLGSIGPVLVTARHNLTGKNHFTGKYLNSKAGAVPNNLLVRQFYLGERRNVIFYDQKYDLYEGNDINFGKPLWKEHPRLGSECDVAAITAKGVFADSDFSYEFEVNKLQHVNAPFSPQEIIKPGKRVEIIGYPFGKKSPGELAVWTGATIASETNGIESDEFWVDCRARPGQSGSPVISYFSDGVIPVLAGQVFLNRPISILHGMYTGRINSDSDIGVVVKSDVIRELVDTT